MFEKKKHTGGLTRQEALNCIPVRNPEAAEQWLDSGEVVLTYPVALRPWLAGLTRRLGGEADGRRVKRLQLDHLGAAVWKLIDGRLNVAGLTEAFAGEYQLHPLEAEASVSAFLRELGRRGLVALR